MVAHPEVHTDSGHEFHKDLWRTLVLLKIDATRGRIYFVVEGMAIHEVGKAPDSRYFYEEHTCPTNFIGKDVVAVYEGGNGDPHGVFDFVRAIWMPQRYIDAKNESEERGNNMGWEPEDVIEELFPEILEGRPRRCIHQGRRDPMPGGGNSMSIGLNGDTTAQSGGRYTEIHYVAPGESCDRPDRIIR